MRGPVNYYPHYNEVPYELQPSRVLTTVVSNQNQVLDTDANLATEQNILQTLEQNLYPCQNLSRQEFPVKSRTASGEQTDFFTHANEEQDHSLQQAGASGTGGWMEILTLGSLQPSGRASKGQRGQRGQQGGETGREAKNAEGKRGWGAFQKGQFLDEQIYAPTFIPPPLLIGFLSDQFISNQFRNTQSKVIASQQNCKLWLIFA